MTRLECPIGTCRFEHPLRRTRVAGIGHELPNGTVLVLPTVLIPARVRTHLRGHSAEDWIAEVIRLREILADPDNQVAAARELQQLALERTRRIEAERDAALQESERLRARLATAAAKSKRAAAQRATDSACCPVCERTFMVRRDGRIRVHNQPGKALECSGSRAKVKLAAGREAVGADV